MRSKHDSTPWMRSSYLSTNAFMPDSDHHADAGRSACQDHQRAGTLVAAVGRARKNKRNPASPVKCRCGSGPNRHRRTEPTLGCCSVDLRGMCQRSRRCRAGRGRKVSAGCACVPGGPCCDTAHPYGQRCGARQPAGRDCRFAAQRFAAANNAANCCSSSGFMP
jgi:hypothetical protein